MKKLLFFFVILDIVFEIVTVITIFDAKIYTAKYWNSLTRKERYEIIDNQEKQVKLKYKCEEVYVNKKRLPYLVILTSVCEYEEII